MCSSVLQDTVQNRHVWNLEQENAILIDSTNGKYLTLLSIAL